MWDRCLLLVHIRVHNENMRDYNNAPEFFVEKVRSFIPESHGHLQVSGKHEMNPDNVDIVIVDRTQNPFSAIVLKMSQEFVQDSSEAWILKVLQDRLKYWLGRGFPARERDSEYPVDPITLDLYQEP